MRTSAQWLSKQNDKVYPLNLKKYEAEQKKISATVKEIDSLGKLTHGLTVEPLESDLKRVSYDVGKKERFNQWIKSLRSDIYLGEAVNVLDDMIVQTNLVYNKK